MKKPAFCGLRYASELLEENGVPEYLADNFYLISIMVKVFFVGVFLPVVRTDADPVWEPIQKFYS